MRGVSLVEFEHISVLPEEVIAGLAINLMVYMWIVL